MIHILGHQGGWDELLLFVAPVLILVWGIAVAERRRRQRSEDESTTTIPASKDQ